MPDDKSNAATTGQSRRQFLKRTGVATAAVAGAGLFELPFSARAENVAVALVLDDADPLTKSAPVQWAGGQLIAALGARGISAQIYPNLKSVPSSELCILGGGPENIPIQGLFNRFAVSPPAGPESLALWRGKISGRTVVLAVGSDKRGLVYALSELADRVTFADHPLDVLHSVKTISERPANQIRSISRAFVSNVEDKSWYQNPDFWPPYLDMLAAQRFNRFNLAFGIGYDFTTDIRDCYLHFAYPFLLEVPGYDVRASGLPDSERDLNLQMLRYVSDETARRGLHFQLGLWTHAYQWTDSPNANYIIQGLTPETHFFYCRDALRALLTACPNISGITFRIHGESGVPEGNYGLWKTIFDGAKTCGRRVEIDMHAKGMDQGMIDVALGTELPVNVSPKFWAEHMGLPYMQGAIRPQEMPPRNARTTGLFKLTAGARSFLRYGYGDLLTEDRRYGILHRIWPGTQRLLSWADPVTAAAYGRVASFCGSNGVEIFEPLFFKGRKGSGLPGGRDGIADNSLQPAGGDFEKYRDTYRVWGRCLYNPDGDPEALRRQLHHPFGKAAEKAAGALASASRILPLVTTAHCPSAANNGYWPEMYTHMPIVDASRPDPYSDTPTPRRLGNVSPLDPEFFLSIDAFADELIHGNRTGKYSPAWVAQQLDEHAERAASQLRAARSAIHDPAGAEFRRLATDVSIQAGLGRFFALKFRAGMLYAIYERTNHRRALEEAIKANHGARMAWATLAEEAKDVYRPDITFGYDKQLRGHWLDRLPAMDLDIADMEQLLTSASVSTSPTDLAGVESVIREVLSPAPRPDASRLAKFHIPPRPFAPGKPVLITASLANVKQPPKLAGAHLHYRRVNQAEAWQVAEMNPIVGGYRAEIPGDYCDSKFPLQYYFELSPVVGIPELYPSLQPGWKGQPYFVVRHWRESSGA